MRQVAAAFMAFVFLSSAAWTFTHEEKVEGCHYWLKEEFVKGNCRAPISSRAYTTQCTCSRFLGEEENDDLVYQIAIYMARWMMKTTAMKRECIHEWYR